MRRMLTLNVVLLALIASLFAIAAPAGAQGEPEPTASPSPSPTESPASPSPSPTESPAYEESQEESAESQESEAGSTQESSESSESQESTGESSSDVVDVGAIHDSLPFPELTVVEDTLDGAHNNNLDAGNCTVDVAWPQKVQDSTTGQYFVYSQGAASCPGYDHLAVKICVQIKVAGDWKRLNCNADADFGSVRRVDVLGPCRAGTWKYRSKFTWAASYVATSSGFSSESAVDAASSGTRKSPRDGVKRTCPA